MNFEKNVRMATMADVNESVIPKATSQQVENIKSQISTETANVKIMPYKVYSPNEQVVGEWQEVVDGVLKQKPVYEKTIAINSLSTTTRISHNISDFGRLVKLYGTFNNSGEKYNIPDPSTDKNYSISTTATSSQINLFFGTGWSSYLSSITDTSMTIQYTKTTDQWETVE